MLDQRATERHDAKLPLNINDTDLSAEDAVAPTAGNECTEISFCLISYKYTAALCLLRNPDPLPGRILPNRSTRTIEERKRLVEECQNQLEDEHFKNCFHDSVFCRFTATIGRAAIANCG